MSTKLKIFVGSLMFACFIGGLVVSGRMSVTQSGSAAPAPPQTRQMAALAPVAGLPNLSPIAERALKVAANISSTSVTVPSDPFERRWFGAQTSQSLGSGVVVSSDGYVLTNTHVIGNARADIKVTLADGRERQGRLIGIDDISDLAVVKVEAQNLETLPWGDSSKLRVAEWVLAIGNPFQLSGTVTLGIVSTVSRPGSEVGAISEVIQTDAAINPGNSGGALVNSRAELVGINSMIYTETGGYQGIGFAIPSNTAREIMNQLIQYREVRWGSIGAVQLLTIDRATAQYNGLGDVVGAYVRAIAPSSAAAQAGLRRGDIIVAMNDQPISDANQLLRMIVNAKVSSNAKLEIVRGGRRIPLNVPIVSR